MISFASVPLNPPPDPDGLLAGFLRGWWHAHGIREFEFPGYLTAGIDHLPIPALPQYGCPRPGVLVWPNSASRFAVFHALVPGEQLTKIGTAALSDGGTLVLDDGTDAISATMYPLAPRVVCRHAGADYFLITLVDERYFWWQAVASVATPATWAGLLTALLAAVGVDSPEIAAIPSGYGSPDPTRWDVGYKPLPLLIDAACSTVGLRLARGLDGSVVCAAAADASSQEDDQWEEFEPECMSGGQVAASWVQNAAPQTVTVVFPGASPATTDVTLASLALPDFGDATGVVGAAGFVAADLTATAGSSARTAYATQAATDYYLWALGRVDATFRGFVAWGPTGNEDRIEWDHAGKPLTRVFRSSAADRNLYGGVPALTDAAPLPGTAAAAGCDKFAGLDADNDCLTGETEGTPSGKCADVPQQSFTLAKDDTASTAAGTDVWVSAEDWKNKATSPTVTGKLHYQPEGNRLTLVSGDLSSDYEFTPRGCRDGALYFSGGGRLCDGTAGPTCGPNVFVLSLTCGPCATISVCACTLPAKFCLTVTPDEGAASNCTSGAVAAVVAYTRTDTFGTVYYDSGFVSGTRFRLAFFCGAGDPALRVSFVIDCVGATIIGPGLWDGDPDHGNDFLWDTVGGGTLAGNRGAVPVECNDPAEWTLPLYAAGSTDVPRPAWGTLGIAPYDPETGCGDAGGDGSSCDEASALACGTSTTVHVPSGATRWLKVTTSGDATLTLSGGTGTATVYGGTCDSLGVALGSTDGSAPLPLDDLADGTYLVELENTGSGADFTVSLTCLQPGCCDDCTGTVGGSVNVSTTWGGTTENHVVTVTSPFTFTFGSGAYTVTCDGGWTVTDGTHTASASGVVCGGLFTTVTFPGASVGISGDVVVSIQCVPPPAPSYACTPGDPGEAGSCADPGDGSGPYATLEECLENCTGCPDDACNAVSFLDPFDGTTVHTLYARVNFGCAPWASGATWDASAEWNMFYNGSTWRLFCSTCAGGVGVGYMKVGGSTPAGTYPADGSLPPGWAASVEVACGLAPP